MTFIFLQRGGKKNKNTTELTNLTVMERERKRTLTFLHIVMNQSGAWVSHTPDKLQTKKCDAPQDKLVAPQEQERKRTTVIEKFFRPLESNQSAFVQAAQSNSNSNTHNRRVIFPQVISESRSDISLQTQSFASAAEDLSLHTCLEDNDDEDDLSVEEGNLFHNDVLGFSFSTSEQDTFIQDTNIIMSKRRNKTMKTAAMSGDTPITVAPIDSSTPTSSIPTTTTTASTDHPHFDALDHVYEGAKSAWTFGKNIAIVKPFFGIAETVAVKVIQVTTGVESLDDVDKNIKPHVSGIDKDLLDPAILAVLKFLEPIIGKGSEVVSGMVGLVHKVPLLKNNPEVTSPEISAPASEEVTSK